MHYSASVVVVCDVVFGLVENPLPKWLYNSVVSLASCERGITSPQFVKRIELSLGNCLHLLQHKPVYAFCTGGSRKRTWVVVEVPKVDFTKKVSKVHFANLRVISNSRKKQI